LASSGDVRDTQANEVAASQLVVDRHVEQREIAMTIREFKDAPETPRHVLAEEDAFARRGGPCSKPSGAPGWRED